MSDWWDLEDFHNGTKQPLLDDPIDLKHDPKAFRAQAEVEAATSAVIEAARGALCVWVDMGTKRACRINAGQECLCRKVAIAALRSSAGTFEEGVEAAVKIVEESGARQNGTNLYTKMVCDKAAAAIRALTKKDAPK